MKFRNLVLLLLSLTLLVYGCEEPSGLGYEQEVPLPEVSYPLPVVENAPNNSASDTKYSVDDNPIAYALRGINHIWKGTTDNWQSNASSYTDEENGYEGGDGPNPYDAPNGLPSDYVEPGTEIIDAQTWKANMAYVIEVTNNRTEDEALRAFLDDRRSKNYSVIDGFGPLTEEYVAASEAYYEFTPMKLSDVLSNSNFYPEHNDSTIYGGSTSATLGAMVQLAQDFRSADASTSGSKYVFGTPRPWRMNDEGEINFLGVVTHTCYDAEGNVASHHGEDVFRIDAYESSVSVVPGLACARRVHNPGKEADALNDDGSVKTVALYTPTTENRRKDNGYPSGHTNAGILASMAYAYAFPQRYAEMVVRGSDLGESRILAGMHSPIDVIGGRIQALAISAHALNIYSEDAAAAYQQAQEYFGAKAEEAGMTLYDYAHREVAEGSFKDGDAINIDVFNNNFYSDHDEIKALYLERITYGLPQNGTIGLDPVVPEGAERLLQTRQPYLTAAQRRAVLATTEIESGYPLLDESNGWGRINLVAASDGYGAFNGDVSVVMDADQGGFSAHDWWRNDISGEGKLTKGGTGTLTLTGRNSYSGGTVIKAGTLEAASPTAFGTGDLYMTGGTALISAPEALVVEKRYTQKGGTLKLHVGAGEQGTLKVGDTMTLVCGDLVIDFADGYTPSAGDTFKIITAERVLGSFTDVSTSAEGYALFAEYTGCAVIIHVGEKHLEHHENFQDIMKFSAERAIGEFPYAPAGEHRDPLNTFNPYR
jgi:autotransporter-associated beta strand protein